MATVEVILRTGGTPRTIEISPETFIIDTLFY